MAAGPSGLGVSAARTISRSCMHSLKMVAAISYLVLIRGVLLHASCLSITT